VSLLHNACCLQLGACTTAAAGALYPARLAHGCSTAPVQLGTPVPLAPPVLPSPELIPWVGWCLVLFTHGTRLHPGTWGCNVTVIPGDICGTRGYFGTVLYRHHSASRVAPPNTGSETPELLIGQVLHKAVRRGHCQRWGSNCVRSSRNLGVSRLDSSIVIEGSKYTLVIQYM
jgi:hypothetical protein